MKALQVNIIYLGIVLLFNASMPTEKQGNLMLEIHNIRTAQGTVWVGIYDNEKHYFNQSKALVKAKQVSATGRIALEINDLRYGSYAVALFHDINDNGILDRNALGVPTEPYAFSQLPPSKWRLPKFDEIKFKFEYNNQVLQTKLQCWWD